MKILLLSLFLSLLVGKALSWELRVASYTSLAPGMWRETLECLLGYAMGNVRARAEFGNAGFAGVVLGGELQRRPWSLGGDARFDQTGFTQANLEIGLRPVEYFGVSVAVALEPTGFGGASFSFWCETAPAVGGAGFTGVFTLDRAGTVVGQCLRVGCSLPPLRFDSTARFNEQGFSSLELGAGLQREEVKIHAGLGFDPAGLERLGGELRGALGSFVAALEGSWFVSGSWLWAAAVSLDSTVEARGRLSSSGGTYSWEAEITISLGFAWITFGLATAEGGLSYQGGLRMSLEWASLELRGHFRPDGAWAAEASWELRFTFDSPP